MGDQCQFPGSSGDDGDSPKDQETKKILTETGIDRISELPDAIIVQILSLLPVTDAYKTSILAKHWQYLWTCIDCVVFDRILEVNQFISFTDTVLSHLSCTNIKKFHLSFDLSNFDNSDAVLCYSKIDKWLEIAVNKKVEDLDLDICFSGELEYCLSRVLFTSSSILKLKCTYFRMPEEFVLNWTSLKSLTLEYLYIGDEQIEKILLGCLQLESLSLTAFAGFHRLHITSPKCRSVQLVDHWYNHNWSRQVYGPLEIIAPHVQHLKILELLDGVEISFGDLSSLVHVDLNFSSYNCLNRLNDVTANTKVINNLLATVRCANELTLPSWLTEVLSLLIFEKKYTSLPLLEFKQLTINSWYTEFSLLAVASLLRSTPYLESLRILPELECHGVKLIEDYVEFWNEDFDLSTNNFISLQNNILKGSIQNLKNVEIKSEFCGFYRAAGASQLPRFLKSLLEHAISLEKLVIASDHGEGNKCPAVPKLITRLSALPRASHTAIISYVGSLEE